MASDREDPEIRINGDHAGLAPGEDILVAEDADLFVFEDDDLLDDDELLIVDEEEDEDLE